MEVNKLTIEEHIEMIGMPHAWGTHVEVLAIATLYGISVYSVVHRIRIRLPRIFCYFELF